MTDSFDDAYCAARESMARSMARRIDADMQAMLTTSNAPEPQPITIETLRAQMEAIWRDPRFTPPKSVPVLRPYWQVMNPVLTKGPWT